ncbi:MAG: hypothetical protein HW374_558 [Bacteroidetes bacterium]|nr:hypothetical protein [Bacteroidota bacterium]
MDRSLVDAERLLARQHGSTLSMGTHAHSAVVAQSKQGQATAGHVMFAIAPHRLFFCFGQVKEG